MKSFSYSFSSIGSMDKLAAASMELQLTVFKAQVRLSEELSLIHI